VDLISRFNIILSEQELKQMKIPIECSVLDIFTMSCPYPVELQYRVGKYRLDAFIPRLNLAIQVDEETHRWYDQKEEKEYDAVLRDHNIVSIRYRPELHTTPPFSVGNVIEGELYEQHKHLNAALRLVAMVWTRTLSPDFRRFM